MNSAAQTPTHRHRQDHDTRHHKDEQETQSNIGASSFTGQANPDVIQKQAMKNGDRNGSANRCCDRPSRQPMIGHQRDDEQQGEGDRIKHTCIR